MLVFFPGALDRFCPTPRAKLSQLDHEYDTSNWPDARSDPETTQSPPVHARHAPTVGETQLLLQQRGQTIAWDDLLPQNSPSYGLTPFRVTDQ